MQPLKNWQNNHFIKNNAVGNGSILALIILNEKSGAEKHREYEDRKTQKCTENHMNYIIRTGI